MTPHTCQEKPNSEGRTSSNCDGCYSTAYGDGNHAGGKQAVETMQKRMEQTVLENMNPLNEGEEKAATLRWHEGRRILGPDQEHRRVSPKRPSQRTQRAHQKHHREEPGGKGKMSRRPEVTPR